MLQLPTTDPTMDLRKRILWNPEVAADVVEAQEKIEALRSDGFTVETANYGELVLAPPMRDRNIALLRVLDETGDSHIVWDRRDVDQIAEARKKFEEYISQGYRGYVCRSDGTKGRKVETFDALLEEMILQASPEDDDSQLTPTESALREAPKKNPEGVMIPPTHPG